MGDVQSVGGSVEQAELSQGATVSPQVRKRSSLVQSLSEQTSSKRPRQHRSFAHSVPKSNPIPLTSASRCLSSSPQAFAESGTAHGDGNLTRYEAKRTKRAMRAIRALQGLGSEQDTSSADESEPPPKQVARRRPLPSHLVPAQPVIGTNLILSPLSETYVNKDSQTLSFAKGAKYRGRKRFHLAAHRVCFDHGFELVVEQGPEICTPNGKCPRRGRFTLVCSHGRPPSNINRCPFQITLGFTLSRWGKSDEDPLYKITRFVNAHNHGRSETLRTYGPPLIDSKTFWPKRKGAVVGSSGKTDKEDVSSTSCDDTREIANDEVVEGVRLPWSVQCQNLQPHRSTKSLSQSIDTVSHKRQTGLKGVESQDTEMTDCANDDELEASLDALAVAFGHKKPQLCARPRQSNSFAKNTSSLLPNSASTHFSTIPLETRLLRDHPDLTFSLPNSPIVFRLDFFARLLQKVERPGSHPVTVLRQLLPAHSRLIVNSIKAAWEIERGQTEEVQWREWEDLSKRFERGLARNRGERG